MFQEVLCIEEIYGCYEFATKMNSTFKKLIAKNECGDVISRIRKKVGDLSPEIIIPVSIALPNDQIKKVRATCSLIVDATGTQQYIGGITDIDEETRIRWERDDYRNRLELIENSVRGGVMCYHLTGMRWELMYISPQYRNLLGYTEDEVKGLNAIVTLEIVYPDDRAIVQQAALGLIRDGIPYDIEYRVSKSNGGYIWVKGEAVFYGTLLDGYVYLINTDITETKQ